MEIQQRDITIQPEPEKYEPHHKSYHYRSVINRIVRVYLIKTKSLQNEKDNNQSAESSESRVTICLVTTRILNLSYS